MNGSESTDAQLDRIERKLDGVLQRTDNAIQAAAKPASRLGRVFLGIFVLLIGLVWLGQNLGLRWLSELRFWPLMLILVGVFLMVGGRRR